MFKSPSIGYEWQISSCTSLETLAVPMDMPMFPTLFRIKFPSLSLNHGNLNILLLKVLTDKENTK